MKETCSNCKYWERDAIRTNAMNEDGKLMEVSRCLNKKAYDYLKEVYFNPCLDVGTEKSYCCCKWQKANSKNYKK